MAVGQFRDEATVAEQRFRAARVEEPKGGATRETAVPGGAPGDLPGHARADLRPRLPLLVVADGGACDVTRVLRPATEPGDEFGGDIARVDLATREDAAGDHQGELGIVGI